METTTQRKMSLGTLDLKKKRGYHLWKYKLSQFLHKLTARSPTYYGRRSFVPHHAVSRRVALSVGYGVSVRKHRV
jgi:hypothetical protein